ncbi:MAG: hypothetical protein WAQ57_02545 [Candidatus Saccharimonadales bacterium]
MNGRLSLRFLLNDTRSRVYLLWAVLVTAGFVATHYFQRKEINPVWAVISLTGLGYMLRVMPLRVRQMQHILISWTVPITTGMIISGLAFRTDIFAGIIPYLGVFWLIIMAAGYAWNGLVDGPGGWYYFAAVLNLFAAVLCYVLEPFLAVQYLIAAIVSAWSMLYLWLLRT